ncbi:MarR family winged helix-turn-helix transcriptional regulator [Acrocarpospora catenulata]|uniref:MarR family winged helix-turn-helix transcriptional regulator n=1 Tax=Acrocarpospora catenulata TaxID=2836182 RepID=UPI001BDAF92D|nr:MarR family winged helix-turn-helix transcriptional regulator [Acrocarpospora catenulata]
MAPPSEDITDREYAKLLAFRVGVRRFLRWSEERAAEVGLTAAQHQLLLAIRGHLGALGPTISELAGYLCTRHHSVVQLIDRAEQLGLVTRNRGVGVGADRRRVHLTLTEAGKRKLTQLSATHLEELRRLTSLIDSAFVPSVAVPEASLPQAALSPQPEGGGGDGGSQVADAGSVP